MILLTIHIFLATCSSSSSALLRCFYPSFLYNALSVYLFLSYFFSIFLSLFSFLFTIFVSSPSQLALEFLFKLDGKRYKDMLSSMRNDTLRDLPDAYPETLAGRHLVGLVMYRYASRTTCLCTVSRRA